MMSNRNVSHLIEIFSISQKRGARQIIRVTGLALGESLGIDDLSRKARNLHERLSRELVPHDERDGNNPFHLRAPVALSEQILIPGTGVENLVKHYYFSPQQVEIGPVVQATKTVGHFGSGSVQNLSGKKVYEDIASVL